MTAAGKAKFATFDPLEHPTSNCQSPGLPSIAQIPELQQWSVANNEVTIRHESYATVRTVHLDQTTHPAEAHTVLGHATGRLLLRRDGYKVDLEAVLQAAAKHGAMIEINAQPARLDLDWIHCKRAKALGVKLVINPDAHSTGDLGYTRYGVDVARRGWLEKGDVFNTQTAAQVAKEFQAR